MLRLAIVAAGVYDSAVLPVLAKKCRKGIRVISRQCGGSALGRKALGIIRELEMSRRADAIIVVEDAEGRPPKDLQVQLAGQLRALGNRSNPLPIKVVVAVQMMEAWLLADDGALSRVLGKPRRPRNPENLPDPKAELKKLLSTANIIYTSKVARKIAQAADVEQIAKRCPSFDAFRKVVAGI